MKKKSYKKTPNFEISQDLNALMKKHNIDKAKYIRPYSNNLYYNPENVIEGTKKVEDLICPICYNILKNPINCNSTKKSHSFCEECIKKSLEINDKCPMCKQEFEYGINKKIEKLLQKLKFKCIYAEEGCPKILDYSIYFKHIDKCGFREILYECQVDKFIGLKKGFKKCGYVGTIKKINRHFLKCAFLEINCFFCNQKIIQALFNKHIKSVCCNILYLYKDTKIFFGKHENEFQEPEGFGKLIDDDGIIIGQFSDHIPNGFCINKQISGITTVGEYIFGVVKGYGIMYDQLGELTYEGEVKNSMINGIGTLYLENGSRYEGEFINGTREGYGILYQSDDSEIDRYEGEFKNDLCEGLGIIYYKNGKIYNGEMKDDNLEGFGLELDKSYYYRGQFKDGCRYGYGIINYRESDLIYKGEFRDVPEGFGFIYYPNGDIYEGEFSDNKKHVLGIYFTVLKQ